jgi:ubiquinone biosynthesis protein
MEARYSPQALAKRAARRSRRWPRSSSACRGMWRACSAWRAGSLRIDLDLKRLDHFGLQLNSAANRLTMGVLTASLVVGSSIIMTVEGGPELFGLPLFGLLGFVVAFFNSVWISTPSGAPARCEAEVSSAS